MRPVLWTTLIAGTLAASPVAAWTVDEHRLLADSALSVASATLDPPTRARLRGALRAAWSGDRTGEEAPTFGSVCAAAAADDHSAGRYHLGGRTVCEQLAPLSAARIDTFTSRARRGDAQLLQGNRHGLGGRVRSLGVGNVVANYLVHHVAALRLAGDAAAAAGDPDSLLRRALLYEAIAQGYLADAFATGHLVPPPGRRLRSLHPVNRQRLHDHYGNLGLYLLDARGETWHALGDRLLLWYGPSFDHVFDACVASVTEVLNVRSGGLPRAFEPGIPGSEWLTRLRLPALLRVPTVALATWSVRTDSLDTHGLGIRHHYPQLRDPGGHDPTLEPDDVGRLPSAAAVPDWMIAPELFKTDPLVLVRERPDYASARFIQPRHPPPAHKGVVVSAGWARFKGPNGDGARWGLGYAPAAESPLLVQRLSIDAHLLEPIARGGPRPVALGVGFNLKLPRLGVWRSPWLRWVGNTRLSGSHAWGRIAGPYHDGARYTAGFESPVLPVRFTNAAVVLRLEAEWWRFEQSRRGVAVSLVMQ